MIDMSKEAISTERALKLALNKAFQLGQRYWSWADSEYSSHWKKADAAKAEFDKLVENTYEAIANDHENPVQIDPSAGTQISKVWWDGEKLMAKPIPFVEFYKPAPATELREQEPVGYVAENGIVDWNVCAPPIMTDLYTSPPTLSLAQRQSRSDVKPLTDEEIWKDDAIMAANSGYGANFETLRELIRAIEAAHGIKGDA